MGSIHTLTSNSNNTAREVVRVLEAAVNNQAEW